MQLRSSGDREVLSGVRREETGVGTGRGMEVQMRGHGDRKVLPGMRLTEAVGGGWLDLFLRNGK